jgi:alkyldihydroxyacetonephosphate synthase
MSRLLWLDEKSMLAAFETGISGQDLERVLNERGFTMGHSPDSLEFSTLGGWIATKSSGMKQQTYGNIEDIVVKVKLATSIGVLEHDATTPRSSAGPDFERLVIGSEGTLGVITEAVVKIHKMPESAKFAAFIFPDIQRGIAFLDECSKGAWLPSNLRLFCNSNVQAGLMLEETDMVSGLLHPLKMFLLKNALRYDLEKFTSVSYMVEGDRATVEWKNANLRRIAKKFGGFYVGENVARHSYMSSSVYSVYLRVSLKFFVVIF